MPSNTPIAHAVLADADATRAFGQRLASILRQGDLIVLTGDLGAGKTTLTQGIGKGLKVRGQVASPTFTVSRIHPSLTGGPALIHVDAYRLKSLDEVDALDIEALMEDSVTVVEWGEGWVEQLSRDRLVVSIDRPHGDESGSVSAAQGDELDVSAGDREISVFALGPRWADVRL
jgi:tRNA threonylcarbamoyladenosine biosynthesis protein TsaE